MLTAQEGCLAINTAGPPEHGQLKPRDRCGVACVCLDRGARRLGRRQNRRKCCCSKPALTRELVGNFKNAGAKWDRQPTPVNDHDFRSLAEGVAILYGIYEPETNRGSMFVGVSHETSAFAVTSIRNWWGQQGRQRFIPKPNTC